MVATNNKIINFQYIDEHHNQRTDGGRFR